jgi:1-acyl-sn-glycerol-3-phosphate acyltransferase
VGANELGEYHSRALDRGVSLALYLVVRAIMQPIFHVYFRMRRTGMEHVPKSGPVIFASNHRSFLDPFVIGTLTRRPVYYVAKKELFAHPVAGWLLNRLGAFPIDRGAGDQQAMETARRILDAALGALRCRPGRRSCRLPCSAPRRCDAAGGSAPGRSHCAAGARCRSRASRTRPSRREPR